MAIWTEKLHRNPLVLKGEDSVFAPRRDVAAKLLGASFGREFLVEPMQSVEKVELRSLVPGVESGGASFAARCAPHGKRMDGLLPREARERNLKIEKRGCARRRCRGSVGQPARVATFQKPARGALVSLDLNPFVQELVYLLPKFSKPGQAGYQI